LNFGIFWIYKSISHVVYVSKVHLPLLTSLLKTNAGSVSADNASAFGSSFEDKAIFLAILAINNEISLAI
jgi:hypothetical protein